jgi:hypothetical protein
MAKIKFSHAYKKLIGFDGKLISTAQLLLVLAETADNIIHNKAFIDYDTDNGLYKLSYSNTYLLLLF